MYEKSFLVPYREFGGSMPPQTTMNRLEERKFLEKYYATTPNKDLSQMLGISVGMVMRYAYQIGLRKDPKYLSVLNRKCGLQSPVAKNWKCK